MSFDRDGYVNMLSPREQEAFMELEGTHKPEDISEEMIEEMVELIRNED